MKIGGHLLYWKNLSTGLRRETDISFPLNVVALSERKTYCKVEGKVARQLGMNDGQVLLVGCGIGRVDGLHGHVEAQNEVVEIEAETYAI